MTLLTRRELAALLRISTRTLDTWRAAGAILDPVPGPGKPRWIAEEVQRWIEVGRPRASAWRSLRKRWFRAG